MLACVFATTDSLPNLKTSWDNLMWNLEFDDDDTESQTLMDAAKEGVSAALVEVQFVLHFLLLFVVIIVEVFSLVFSDVNQTYMYIYIYVYQKF